MPLVARVVGVDRADHERADAHRCRVVAGAEDQRLEAIGGRAISRMFIAPRRVLDLRLDADAVLDPVLVSSWRQQVVDEVQLRGVLAPWAP